MSLTAFLHGYPPIWSMGGEMSTHRTLQVVPEAIVFTKTLNSYYLDGVSVLPMSGSTFQDIMEDAEVVGATVLFGHSTLSQNTIRAARRLKLPSILAVHAPPRFGIDLRRAWSTATVRLYNTEAARKEWHDPKGWLLHPPIGDRTVIQAGPRDALTTTSSLLNKGVHRVLGLARLRPEQRFIIVESPAHLTHGSPLFWEEAEAMPNVEIWPRLHPDDMGKLWTETHILLVPSRYETYGMVALEAAWHGIPSVHVDTPHVQEGIGEAARLLRSQSLDELDQAVTEVERRYEDWSEAAYNRVVDLAERETDELARFAAGVAGLAPS